MIFNKAFSKEIYKKLDNQNIEYKNLTNNIIFDNHLNNNNPIYHIILPLNSPTVINNLKNILYEVGINNFIIYYNYDVQLSNSISLLSDQLVKLSKSSVEQQTILSGNLIKALSKNINEETVYQLGNQFYVKQVIITFGRSLYTVSESTDIIPDDVDEYPFANLYYTSGKFKNKYPNCYGVRVFPISNYFLTPLYDNHNSDSSKVVISELGDRFKYIIKINQKPLEEYDKLIRDYYYYNVLTQEDFNKFMESVNEDYENDMLDKYAALDIETTGLNRFRDEINNITISWDGKTGFYIDYKLLLDKENREKFYCMLKKFDIITANGKFDIGFLNYKLNWDLNVGEDIIGLGRCLNYERSNSLKALTFWFLPGKGGYENNLKQYMKENNIEDFTKVPFDILSKYAMDDAINSFEIFKRLKGYVKGVDDWINKTDNKLKEKHIQNRIRKYTVWENYKCIYLPLLNVFIDMEKTGFYVNNEMLNEFRREMLKYKQEQVDMFLSFFPKTTNRNFNIDSGKELGIFLEEQGWEDLGRSKLGYYNTDDTTLETWKTQYGHLECEYLQNMRSCNTNLNTYLGEEVNFNLLKSNRDNPSLKGWTQHCNKYPEEVEGYLKIEQEGKIYIILNDQTVNTINGPKKGYELTEQDILILKGVDNATG